MSALSEQLVDDYLRRLSAAGRGRLTRAERRALVTRTRYFIRQSTEATGDAADLDVPRFLAELGDPAGIVQAEVARLAAAHGESVPEGDDRAQGLSRVPRRLSRQARLNWPSQPARSPHLTESLMAAAEDEAPAEDDATAEDEAAAEDEATDGQDGPVLTGKIIRPRPSWPSVVATDASWLDSVLDRGTYGEEVRPGEALDGETDEEPLDEELLDEELLDEELLDEEVLEEPEPASYRDVWGKLAHWPRLVRPWVTLLAAWLADSFRKHPIESLAAVLLGIGGAAFPPVWLLGAAMALVSHLWDGRDKWIGLALPVIGTLLGTVAGVCLTASGSLGHDVHNGWVFADVLSRIAAVIGATYLGWRGVRGRRPPAVPPWARAHRVG